MSQSKILIAGLFVLGFFLSAVSTFAYQGQVGVAGPKCNPDLANRLETIMATNDYSAWKELKAGRGRVTEVITADNFPRYAEAWRLAKSGQLAEAKKIFAELGLGQGRKLVNCHWNKNQ